MQSIKNYIKKFMKRGDTIIEVTIAISIFSLVSVLSLQLMDRDIAIIQGALETEMARNEIDAQAEALRYIQNAYLSERELATNKREYQNLWQKLSRGSASAGASSAGSGLTNDAASISKYSSVACKTYYENSSGDYHSLFTDKGFVLNTRKIDPTNVGGTIVQSAGSEARPNVFKEAQLYPRIIYTNSGGTHPSTINLDGETLSEFFPEGSADPTWDFQNNRAYYDRVVRAEGIWVISVQQQVGTNKTPEFYDFHIRTCWFAPGHDQASTIATTIRLYNPEYIEAQR